MSNYKDPPPPYAPHYPEYVPSYNGPPPTAGYPPGPPPATIYPPNTGSYYVPPVCQVPPTGYGATSTTVIVQNPDVIIIGACPACRVGVLEDDFTCLGLLCAIFFFPLGILCCLALREKRCSNCNATFG